MPTYTANPAVHSGILLARTRKVKGLTQGELGEMLGVRAHDVKMWELGRDAIPAETLPDLCGLLGLSAAALTAPGRFEISVKERELLRAYNRQPKVVRQAICRLLDIAGERESLEREAA